MFREPLRAAVGVVVEREGFYFADLMPDPAMVDAREPANNGMQRTALRAAADAERWASQSTGY